MYNLDKHSVMDKYRRYQSQPSSINASSKRNYNEYYNKQIINAQKNVDTV